MARGEELPRIWATMDHFTALGKHRVHWAWARVSAQCARRSPCASVLVTWLHCGGAGYYTRASLLIFFDYKVNKTMAAQPIPPFWESRCRWLWNNRTGHYYDDTIFIRGGPDTLRKL